MANLKGGKPDKLIRDALMIELAVLVDETDGSPPVKRLRKVARRLIEEAEKGNVPAIKEIADRLDGKAPQAIVSDDGGPLTINLVSFSADDHTPK